MLFWIGLAAMIAGIVFAVNDVAWFQGEDNLTLPLIIIGVVLIGAQVLALAYVMRRARAVVRRQPRRGGFFD